MPRTDVLFVEDSAGDALLTQQILAESLPSIKLHIARDGLQALMILCDKTVHPALILLDLNLPVVSGFDVLERNPLKEVPVVIFTASVRRADQDRARSLGAKEFVTKPTDIAGYRSAVIGMVQRWAKP